MHLTKHHALGNDFLVLLGTGAGSPRPDDGDRWSGLARELCARRTGVGADGLILGETTGPGAARFVLHNSDGGRAEISGNGLRCLGQALWRSTGIDRFDIETDVGVSAVQRISGRPDGVANFSVTMGGVTIDEPPAIEAIERLEALVESGIGRNGRASIGNPHVVVEVDDPAVADLETIGVEAQALFGPVNLHLVAVDGDTVTMRPYERGVGATEACGSGACVAATFVQRWTGLTGPIRVEMPGGAAQVTPGEEVLLEGPTTFVADISLEVDGR